ncbi:hypothetical protein SUGI_0333490 [Cryptomeria japonica]|nr:hypothetical protein SUGI_0333490 [Cryptomeria japonica]
MLRYHYLYPRLLSFVILYAVKHAIMQAIKLKAAGTSNLFNNGGLGSTLRSLGEKGGLLFSLSLSFSNFCDSNGVSPLPILLLIGVAVVAFPPIVVLQFSQPVLQAHFLREQWIVVRPRGFHR